MAITLFVCVLSVVSKQLERRDNLSHFDEVFNEHHASEEDDVEAQLQPHTSQSTLQTGGTKTKTKTKTQKRGSVMGDSFTMGTSNLLQEGQTTSLSDCSSAKTFAVNMNPLLGGDLPELPSVRDLCAFDIVIVNPKVKIMSLIMDTDNMCKELSMSTVSGGGGGGGGGGRSSDLSSAMSMSAAMVHVQRPRFLCAIDFATLTQQSSSYISTLLHKGFDGIVLRGMSEAYREQDATATPNESSADR